MSMEPTHTGGRRMRGKSDWGSYDIECDVMGRIIRHNIIVRQPIDADYDPAKERRGCCDPPEPSMRR